MTFSQWWWAKKKKKEMSSRMNHIEANLDLFNYRTANSFGINPRNGTMDMSCHILYKLNDKKEGKITMGPSQACYSKILESIIEEKQLLDRFISRYKGK